MAKRKASFLGSQEWADRDVFFEYEDDGKTLVVADVPSGIAITFWQQPLPEKAEALRLLAHRVKQLDR